MRNGILRVVWTAWALAACATSPTTAQYWEVGNRALTAASVYFGFSLAAGDFDGDGDIDLAVGNPHATSPDGWSWSGAIFLYRTGSDRSWTRWGLPWYGVTTLQGNYLGWDVAAGDFDGDGRDELAAASVGWGGRVDILDFGSEWSVVRTFTQDDVPDTEPELNDFFGEVLDVGDFDADGLDDLVVATPHEDSTLYDVGAVHVIYGGGWSTNTVSSLTFVAGQRGLLGSPSDHDYMGAALATGDFNDDAYDDLAFSAPFREVAGHHDAGQVHVVYGSTEGLTLIGQQLVDDGSFATSAPGPDEMFGASLAAGRFDDSLLGCVLFGWLCPDDLAIGVPGQTVGEAPGAGKLVVSYGGAGGLQMSGETQLTQADAHSSPEPWDAFGGSLAAGRADSDGFEDLVVGSAYAFHTTDYEIYRAEDYYATDDGYVQLFYGSPAGLHGGQSEQAIAQWPVLAVAPAESDEHFGDNMLMADFDGDGHGDLAVGMPGELSLEYVGAVQILYGALFASGFENGDFWTWSSVSP